MINVCNKAPSAMKKIPYDVIQKEVSKSNNRNFFMALYQYCPEEDDISRLYYSANTFYSIILIYKT